MNGDEFVRTAQTSTASLHLDPAALIEGVYRRRRRRRIARFAGGLSALAIVAVAVSLTATVITKTPSESQVAANGTAEAAQLSPYEMSSTPARPLVTVDGVSLTYLPASMGTDAVTEEGSTAAGETYVYAQLQGACEGAGDCEDSLGVTVTRADGLTLDRYLETHWFGDSTDTTVDGAPAKANDIEADEAAGIVWSPARGTVIEMHINSALAPELRKIVDGVRLG